MAGPLVVLSKKMHPLERAGHCFALVGVAREVGVYEHVGMGGFGSGHSNAALSLCYTGPTIGNNDEPGTPFLPNSAAHFAENHVLLVARQDLTRVSTIGLNCDTGPGLPR